MTNQTLAEQILSRSLLRQGALPAELTAELITFANYVREGRRPAYKLGEAAGRQLQQVFPNPRHPVWAHVPHDVARPELSHKTVVDNVDSVLKVFAESDSARELIGAAPESFVRFLRHMLSGECADFHNCDTVLKLYLETNFPQWKRPWEFEIP